MSSLVMVFVMTKQILLDVIMMVWIAADPTLPLIIAPTVLVMVGKYVSLKM